jgi:hypothetical protein
VFTLRHSWIIFCTFRRHSVAARSYPAPSSSFACSGEVGGATGAKGKTASALEKRFCENVFHILSIVCCGGSFFFFFFAAAAGGGGGPLPSMTRRRGRVSTSESASEEELYPNVYRLGIVIAVCIKEQNGKGTETGRQAIVTRCFERDGKRAS